MKNKSADLGVNIAELRAMQDKNNSVINNNTAAMNSNAAASAALASAIGAGQIILPDAQKFKNPEKGQFKDMAMAEDFAGMIFTKNGESSTVPTGSRSYKKTYDEFTKAGYTFGGYDALYAANFKQPNRIMHPQGYGMDLYAKSVKGKYPILTGIPKREFGGPTFKDQMYMVGENGPEFFVPSQNGSIISNDISRGMMNQSSNTTNEYALNLTFNGTDMNADDVARKVMDAIKRAGNSNSVYTNRRIQT
jgi:hypothetical protein